MARPLVHFVAEWLDAAWRRRYVILVPILVMPFIGLAVGVLAPKPYVSHTTILVQDAALMNPFLEDLAVPTALEERLPALDALLHSRHVLAAVAQDLGLVAPDAPEAAMAWQIGRLSGMLSLRLIGGDLIKLTATSARAEELAPVLRAAARHLMDRVLAPARSAIAGSQAFLEQQLAEHRKTIEGAEAALAAYRAEHATELPELQAANVSRLNDLRAALVTRRGQLAGAEAAVAAQRSRLAETDPVVGKIEQEQVAAMAQLATLRARYTDAHSEVQALLRKLRRLEEERAAWLSATESLAGVDLDRLWNMASTTAGSLEQADRPLLVSQLAEAQAATVARDSLAREVANLEAEIAQLEEVIRAQSTHEQRLAELTRDLAVKRGVYDELLKRSKMASITGALGRFEETERVKVIDAPFTPSIPATPPTIIFVVAGLFAGIALGGGLAVLMEIADTTLRRAIDIERITSLPVLARIPALTAASGMPLGTVDMPIMERAGHG